MGATQQYEAICALSHSAFVQRELGRWCLLSDVVAEGKLLGLRSVSAVIDDFGDLVELPTSLEYSAARFFDRDLPHAAEQAAYSAWTPCSAWVAPAVPKLAFKPRGVTVCVTPSTGDSVIQYEAEINVQRADRIHPADRLFDLRIGGEEPVWVTDTELRALVVAAGALLGLSVRQQGAAA